MGFDSRTRVKAFRNVARRMKAEEICEPVVSYLLTFAVLEAVRLHSDEATCSSARPSQSPPRFRIFLCEMCRQLPRTSCYWSSVQDYLRSIHPEAAIATRCQRCFTARFSAAKHQEHRLIGGRQDSTAPSHLAAEDTKADTRTREGRLRDAALMALMISESPPRLDNTVRAREIADVEDTERGLQTSRVLLDLFHGAGQMQTGGSCTDAKRTSEMREALSALHRNLCRYFSVTKDLVEEDLSMEIPRNVKFKETVFMEGSPSAGGAALKAVRLLRGSPEPNASNPAACIKTAVDENGRCEEGGAALLKFLRASPALHLSRDRRILWFDRAQGVQNRGTGWEAGERVAGVASVDWSLTNTKQCALVDFLVHKGRVAWDVNIRQLCLSGAFLSLSVSRPLARSLASSLTLSRSLARSLALSCLLSLSRARSLPCIIISILKSTHFSDFA